MQNPIVYYLAKKKLIKNYSPATLTFSITGMCQSRCKTCNIGCMFEKKAKEIMDRDLKIDEIEKIFKSIGEIEFFNISGGEPFLRKDFTDIIELACKYLKPKIIHSPTNALLSEKINKDVRKSLEIIRRYNSKIKFTVKPSIDGVGKLHDEIRGVKGNFECLVKTIGMLKSVEGEFENFHLELGTVVSVFNLNSLGEIEDWVHKQGIQSYRNEIAETREEFFNIGEEITPSAEVYKKLMKNFSEKIRNNVRKKKLFTKILESMRLTYYQIVPKVITEKRQIISCYAGITNVHLNYDGQVWPCCVIGYRKPMGDLRKSNYNFQKIWQSKRACLVREYIQKGGCFCPLANQMYSNILMSPRMLLRSLSNFLKFYI